MEDSKNRITNRRKPSVLEEGQLRKQAYARKKRNKKRRRKALLMRLSMLFVLLSILIGGAVAVSFKVKEAREKREAERAYQEQLIREEELRHQKKKEMIAEAEQIALSYDYEGAIAHLKTIEDYNKDGTILAKIASLEAQKSTMAAVYMDEVTHIFFHSLIVDTDLAFRGTGNTTTAMKQWMTTVDEFETIIQEMYNNGYVLVSIYDLVKQKTNDNGEIEFSTNTIYLPAGKIPYVLSVDDVCYYHSYEGRGIASKLILDENGKVTNTYKQADGTIVTGAYDCITILDKFIEEHPDASYKGAKGTIGVTGYNGILGYRTDIAYKTGENLDTDQKEWLAENPGFNWEVERAEAKAVADALKSNGWTFASNTWGQLAVGSASLERLKTDTEKWKEYVEPLVGETDIIAFSRGQDIGSWRYYSDSNEKFTYLKSQGFNFFCNVDVSQYFMQIRKNYVRQGRRSIDGYRLWNDVHGSKNRTSDLFDATKVLDEKRTDMPGV